MTGYVVFAHGSPIESANESVRAVAADMERRGGMLVSAAFLEGGQPGDHYRGPALALGAGGYGMSVLSIFSCSWPAELSGGCRAAPEPRGSG